MLLKWLCMMNNKTILALAMLLAVISCSCTTKQRDLPDVEPVGLPRYSSGLSFPSKTLNTNVPYDILLPADYNEAKDRRYPVVYMFHGYGDDNTSWNGSWLRVQNKIDALEKEGLEPMIYVFPNGWKAYGCNRYDGTFNYMDMIADEFVPMIDATYRTIADREHRATVGYSMGGFAAMVNAMKHPELFSMSAPLSMSMRTDEQYKDESQDGWNSQWGKIFGGWGQSGDGRITDYYREHCPLHQFTAGNKDVYSRVHWFLTCGDNEQQLLIANDDLHVLMRDNGYAHEYRVWDGGHNSSYWRGALEEVLPYFSSLMAGNTGWDKSLIKIEVPQDVTFNDDGVYCSKAYVPGEGVGILVAHDHLDPALLADALSILQDGIGSKIFVLLPCDLSVKSISEWLGYYKDIYPVASHQAVVLGTSGTEVLARQALFSSLYFEGASLEGDITIDAEKFYYIGQSDDSPAYRSANALYKACKLGGAGFEYRCRNSLNDAREDFLAGVRYIRENLRNI